MLLKPETETIAAFSALKLTNEAAPAARLDGITYDPNQTPATATPILTNSWKIG